MTYTFGERLVHGIPRSKASHPHAVLGEDGRLLTIADGSEISRYELIQNDLRVEAKRRWTRKCHGPVTALIDAGSARLVAIGSRAVSSKAEIIDAAGQAHALAEIPGSVRTGLVARERLFLVVCRDTHVGSLLMEIDCGSGRIVSETPLDSCDVDLSASPSGNYIAISDRENRTISTRSTLGKNPCPPTAATPDAPVMTPKASTRGPCDCHDPASVTPGAPGTSHRAPSGSSLSRALH
jgi:hypothetical protein